jgi:hypothetical protein
LVAGAAAGAAQEAVGEHCAPLQPPQVSIGSRL